MRNHTPSFAIGRTGKTTLIIVVIIALGSAIAVALANSGGTLIGGGTPRFALSSPEIAETNDTLGLSLELSAAQVESTPGHLRITTSVFNARNSINSVTVESAWPYPPDSLNPNNPCGTPGAVGFGISRGYYDQSNYSAASMLLLYNANAFYGCTTNVFPSGGYYSFSPNSDVVEIFSLQGKKYYAESFSLSSAVGGYYEPGSSSYHVFSAGKYTIVAADEWGQVALLHFNISSSQAALYAR